MSPVAELQRLLGEGQFAAVLRLSEQLLTQTQEDAAIWRLRALAQVNLEQYEAAAEALRHAVTLRPDSVPMLLEYGSVLSALGRARDAESVLQQAFERDRNDCKALLKLAAVKQQCGKSDEAAMLLRRLVQLEPQHAQAWHVLGDIASARADHAAAARSYQRAVELQPQHAQLHYNLGLALTEQGKLQAGRDALAEAVRLDPKLLAARAQLLYVKRKLCDWQAIGPLQASVLHDVKLGLPGAHPFALMAESDDPAMQLDAARSLARQISRETRAWPKLKRPPALAGEFRLAFISNGFGQHPTGLLCVEFLERLSAERIDLTLFCTGEHRMGPIRDRLLKRMPIVELAGLPSAKAAQRIADANLHALIDLRGFGGGATPEVLAQRPAPVQIGWMAYPGTCGAPWLDHYLADRIVLNAEARASFSETVVDLPGYFQSCDSTRTVPVVTSRSELGLPERRPLLASLSNAYKYNQEVIAAWAAILRAAPEACLCLLRTGEAEALEANLRAAFRALGIASEQLWFVDKSEHSIYLARLAQIDLFLDTWPYGAHTTAGDAVFAGCPVLTITGRSFASRVASSLNAHLGLADLNCGNVAQYIETAIALTRNPAALEVLRMTLQHARSHSAVFDMRQFAQGFLSTVRRLCGYGS